ncbi:MAG: dihydroneopterin aldolase [Candidatus Omnitrophica bacterium]|nr:dihydroneopterin aldolase [Candidatus Omnitrophota bacterium]
MAIIRITDLALKTIIGIFDWERTRKQEVVINVELHFNAAKAVKSDNVKDTVDYKAITKNIIRHVEDSEYFLIEKMASEVLKIVLLDPKVKKAKVRVDKPGALRFARSVSVEFEATNQ